MNKNINEREIQILRLILGDAMVKEFLEYLNARNNDQYQSMKKSFRIVTKKHIVDVSDFSESDLIGHWARDNSYFNEKVFIEPSWLRELKIKCRQDLSQRHIVVFKGANNASDKIHHILEELNYTGTLTENFKLPVNAEYGHVELTHRPKYHLPRIYESDDSDEQFYDRLR